MLLMSLCGPRFVKGVLWRLGDFAPVLSVQAVSCHQVSSGTCTHQAELEGVGNWKKHTHKKKTKKQE